MNSTGPRSVPGKETTRYNSTKHGRASETILAEEAHPDYGARLAGWAVNYRPTTPETAFALETAVAMTFRIAECAASYRAAVDAQKGRAYHAWDSDRTAEAAALFGRLKDAPEAVAPQLQGSAHGIGVVPAC